MPGSQISERRAFPDFNELRQRLDQAFRDLSDGMQGGGWSPSIDVIRRDDSLVLRADIPGIRPDEVRVDVEGDVLTVSGEHREEKEEKDEHYVRRERRYGAFSRAMALPSGVTADDIEATVRDGILEVNVPLPAVEEKRTIEVKSSS